MEDKMKNRILLLLCCSIALLGLLAGCGSSSDNGFTTTNLRVINESPNVGAIDTFVNGSKQVSNLPYSQASGYSTLESGNYQVRVFPTGQTVNPILDTNVQLNGNTTHTLMIVGQSGSVQGLLLTDDNSQPTAGNARIRFVDASPDTSNVDLRANGGLTTLFSNLIYRDSSAYREVTGGSYDLTVTSTGQPTVVLASAPGTTFVSGGVYTVVLEGLSSNSTLAIRVYTDR
jgi:hypothetical protein